jgi:hypothetical protein
LTAAAALELAAFDERIDELYDLSAFFRRQGGNVLYAALHAVQYRALEMLPQI